MSENWRIDGNCKECRRKKYCTKPCKAHTSRIHLDVLNLLYSCIGDIYQSFPDIKEQGACYGS